MSSEFLRKTNVKDERPRLAESAPRKAGALRRLFSRPLRTGLKSAAPTALVQNCCKIFCGAERPRRWAHLSKPLSQNPHPSENEESGTRARPATRRRERLRHPPLRWFGWMTAKGAKRAGLRPAPTRTGVTGATPATLVGAGARIVGCRNAPLSDGAYCVKAAAEPPHSKEAGSADLLVELLQNLPPC